LPPHENIERFLKLMLFITRKMGTGNLPVNTCIYFLLTVATGFPTGQTPLKTRLEEIRMAVADGASEIDIVINRQFALTGNWIGT
jgi:hypothetical protein